MIISCLCLMLLCAFQVAPVSAKEYKGNIEVTDVDKGDEEATVEVTVSDHNYTRDQANAMSLTAEAQEQYGYYTEESKKIAENTIVFTIKLPLEDHYVIATDSIAGADTSISVALDLRDDTTDIDKSDLAALTEAAEKLKEADYTAESWKEFQAALTVAQTCMADDQATQDEVQAAYHTLKNAMDNLVKRSPVKPGEDEKPADDDKDSAATAAASDIVLWGGALLAAAIIGSMAIHMKKHV